ncbi:alpha/beta hydrolase [Aliiglaciecola sp. LCG003]|uniref:alpha/beta fold hydrolase n=1 Tax=Aliiglaciecola sp. LCG003 TaxID=3053655 RepID=UPI0025739B7A|nr:alpha/beta hydrolase [Aliiglaciecola sp. LCG003]WJG08294.1 alpha/beta hydrolase [Aliiglaciecola sp. LCG003]
MPYADLTEYRNQHHHFAIQGHNIAYWQAGEGETVMLIHGFPSAAWDWQRIWQELSRHYHVVTLDLLGYGLSDKPYPHQYRLMQQADIVEGLVAHLGLSNVHILAHDYGDSVAQELLSRHYTCDLTWQIPSICFLNGGLFSEAHRPLFRQKLLKSFLGPMLAKRMNKGSLEKSFNNIFGKQTPLKAAEIDVLWQLLTHNNGIRILPAMLKYIDERKVNRDRWVEAMQLSKVPLHFINGVQDPISGQHMVERYQQLLDKADCACLPCGHYPHLEMPEKVLECYLTFRQSLS